MARLDNAAWFIGLQRDRGHGSVTIDAAGDAVVHYALTDEVDVRVARRSIEAQIRLHAAGGARGDRPVRRDATPLARPATTSTRSSPRCSASRSAPAATAVLGPPDEQLPNGLDPATSVANPWGELHDTAGRLRRRRERAADRHRRQPDDLDDGGRAPHRGGDRPKDTHARIRQPRLREIRNDDQHQDLCPRSAVCGRRVDRARAGGASTIAVVNPTTEEEIARGTRRGRPRTSTVRWRRACEAFDGWAATAPGERGELLTAPKNTTSSVVDRPPIIRRRSRTSSIADRDRCSASSRSGPSGRQQGRRRRALRQKSQRQRI